MKLGREEVKAVIEQLSPADWHRLEYRSNLLALGLASVSGSDLLQEALTKLMIGDRVFPKNVSPIKVIDNVMRSEASNWREREKDGPIDHYVDVTPLSQPGDEDDDEVLTVVPENPITPERIVESWQLLEAINTAVAEDEEFQELIAVWTLGIKGKNAAEYLGWDMKRYEAASKRLKRRINSTEE